MLKLARKASAVDIARNDFKLDMLSSHAFMNVRVVDEHGRLLGTGRNLGALKAELGAQARGAFQALAALKMASQRAGPENLEPKVAPGHAGIASVAPKN